MAKIVVVDDEPEIAELVAEIAEGQSYQVFMAYNAEQAFNLCLSEKPQLVISDIMMPGLDGYSLCRQLKTTPQLSEIKVILMTAGSFKQDIIRGLYDNFIKKPFNIDELERLLELYSNNQN